MMNDLCGEVVMPNPLSSMGLVDFGMSNGINLFTSTISTSIDKYSLLDAEGINLRCRRFPHACGVCRSTDPHIQKQLDHIVSALFIKATTGDNPWVSVPLDKTAYKGSSISYTHVKKSLSLLELDGFIDVKKGFKGREARYRTRIRATDKLVTLISRRISDEDLSYLDAVVASAVDEPQLDKIVVCGTEPAIGSRVYRSVRVHKKNLAFINENNLKHHIRIPKGSDADISKLVMHRVFNSVDLKDGGRFYGGFWITMPKQDRLGIEINRKPVVEVDYSGMHINLLYKLEGLSLPVSDPYDAGVRCYPRSVAKDALLKMINADDPVACLRAMDSDGDYGLSWDQKKDLVERLTLLHAPISKYFYSGFGIKLQAMDATIAESVMLSFIERIGGSTAILPVHESFLVSQAWEEDLVSIMEDCFMEAGTKVLKKLKQQGEFANPHLLEQSIKTGSCFASTDLSELMEQLKHSQNDKYSLLNL